MLRLSEMKRIADARRAAEKREARPSDDARIHDARAALDRDVAARANLELVETRKALIKANTQLALLQLKIAAAQAELARLTTDATRARCSGACARDDSAQDDSKLEFALPPLTLRRSTTIDRLSKCEGCRTAFAVPDIGCARCRQFCANCILFVRLDHAH